MAAPAADGPLSECNCKVGRVLERWNELEVGDEMATRWVAGDASLRDLAKQINVAVLESATRGTEVAPLDGEIENLYRLLTDDDVTSGTRMQARNRLERQGVDVSAVESDFVSHQTVHTHLKDCLGVERSNGDDDPEDTARRRVRSLQNRMEAVTEDALTRIDSEESEVVVDVTVRCRCCGSRYEFGQFVDQSGCGCKNQ
jgi:hypothetical protein